MAKLRRCRPLLISIQFQNALNSWNYSRLLDKFEASLRKKGGQLRIRRVVVWLVTLIVPLSLVAAACSSDDSVLKSPQWPNLRTKIVSPSSLPPPAVSGQINSNGGPFLTDRKGRAIFFHGVNVVYKYPPYEAYPDPGHPWDFNAHDASLLARLGFNVVRLGITWSGLEPGTAPANDPAICAKGAPSDPNQYNPAVVANYLYNLKKTVDLLGQYHIYSLIDMHQDVYNELFDGEGAPAWAVCTDGRPMADAPGRWSNNYGSRAAGAAFHNFWDNSVVGDLQGEFDRSWVAVARYFADDPWVVGYDPFNEPFSVSLVKFKEETFASQLRCFYEGSDLATLRFKGNPPSHCAPGVPKSGLIPQLLSADPNHLIFYEPDIYTSRGGPNLVGPMQFPRLVFNFHDYCSYRSGKTGNPTDLSACAAQENVTLNARAEDRPELATTYQPGGPAWFMSEFGASSDPGLLGLLTNEADQHLIGWAYWSWKFYNDPTGSADESLVNVNGNLKPTASVLSRPYAMAVAGEPVSTSFSSTTEQFQLTYRPDGQFKADTVVFVPLAVHYSSGYCARATGAKIISGRKASYVRLQNLKGSSLVTLTIDQGKCSGA